MTPAPGTVVAPQGGDVLGAVADDRYHTTFHLDAMPRLLEENSLRLS